LRFWNKGRAATLRNKAPILERKTMKTQLPRVRTYLLTMLIVLLTLTSTVHRVEVKALTCATNPVVINNADSGAGSLRQAILDACDGSTITFANSVTGTIPLATELAVDKNLTIQGPGASALTISGNNAVRVFNIGSVNGPINVTLSGLTIAEGRATFIVLPFSAGFLGGGICSNITGTLTIANCSLLNNNAVDMNNPGLPGIGGGIFANNGSLVATGSTFSGNGGFGGAIFNNLLPLSVTNCTFSGNQCSNTFPGGGAFAGAIYNNSVVGPNNVAGSTFVGNTVINGGGFEDASAGAIYNASDLNVNNCTFAGNTVSSNGFGASEGAGIFTGNGTLNITNCTFVGNTASSSGGSSGGAIFEAGPKATNVKNTIIALNTVTGTSTSGPDVSGAFSSQGHNLIGKGDGGTGFTNGVNGDQVGSIASPLDPKLGPLQNNGGPTSTMALLTGSPAIDAGDDSVLGSPLFLTTDQRGAGFPREFGAHVDIGAFELECSAAPVVTLSPVSQVGTGGSVMFIAAASGTPTPTVQWQVSTDGGATFTNIPGATTATLTFTPTPSQSGSQYRAVFANPCGTATTSVATLTVLDTCLKDNSTGNLLQWNSITGQYKFTRCSDGFTITGTGVVKLVNGIQMLTDFKSDRRISAGFNTGQRTGNATIYLMVVQGVWQSFQIVDTNPAAVCKC
jgi:hypothetical protein